MMWLCVQRTLCAAEASQAHKIRSLGVRDHAMQRRTSYDALSLRESRPLGAGEGALDNGFACRLSHWRVTLPGRYRVRPSRREGDAREG